MALKACSRITDSRGPSSEASPELRAHHDQMFEQAESNDSEVYGSLNEWSIVKRSGHFRRMELLAATDLKDIREQTAVDFGMGPWGFARVFPKLREAKVCIGMDVSLKALQLAEKRDADIADKVRYFTCDGEIIPLEDNTVDVFWGGEVIEHVREPVRFMQEVARVCKDGARVFLSTPNRDAIYYHANHEEYAIGPEHIALMNCTELARCVGTFLDPFCITGYETSLYPAIDRMICDAESAALVQQRAQLFPDCASGLLVDGILRKALYDQYRRNWLMRERLWSGAASAEIVEPMRLFGDVNGGGLPAGGSVEFRVRADKLVLLFWAHDWSGIAQIDVAGTSREIDLYSRDGGFRRLEISMAPATTASLRITRTHKKRSSAVSDQVIFYKIIEYRSE